jgi:hypothetical protein
MTARTTNAPKAVRLADEALAIRRYAARYEGGSQCRVFEMILPKPAAVVFRRDGKGSVMRFDDLKSAQAFFAEFGNEAYVFSVDFAELEPTIGADR